MARSQSGTRAFTLAEVSLAVGLMSVLFVVALTLFVVSMQLSVKAHAEVWSGSDASGAVQRILTDARHAFWVALPDDAKGQFTPPTGTSNSSFTATAGGVTRDTAVEIVFPSMASATLQNGVNSTATATAADRTAAPVPPVGTLWVYRADGDGTPDASAGQCLWMRGSEQGRPVDRAILKSLSPSAPDAVWFERPTDAASPANFLPYQLRIKIVSAYFSPVNGVQTNEASDGTQVTQLTGQCALMRDHELNRDHEPGVSPAAPVSGPWFSN